MSRTQPRIGSMPLLLTLAIAGTLSTLSGQTSNQPSTAKGEWPYYTADIRGSRYSPLDQINAANFNTLTVA